MNLYISWTAAHIPWSATRLPSTTLIAGVNCVGASQSRSRLTTRSRPLHTSTPRRSVQDPIVTATPSSPPSSPTPKKMSDIPGRNEEKPRGTPAVPSPSASIILVSPSNRILLTHRVRTSSAFPSAHVFPGGNLSPSDGPIASSGVARHTDNLAYRTGAIRELFEETGILLARDSGHGGGAPSTSSSHAGLISVKAHDRLRGRRAVHAEKMRLETWLRHQSATAELDTDALVPFTHWITPPNVPKRFSTQMYLYFVPVEEMEGNESVVHATSDGSENTATDWRTAAEWLDLSRRGEIILFPPQFLLLYLVSLHLDGGGGGGGEEENEEGGEWKEKRLATVEQIKQRRENLKRFVESDGTPPWRDKYISPVSLGHDVMSDGRTVLDLSKPGMELKGSGLSGDTERVIFVKFRKEGPREVDVGWRREVFEDKRRVEEEREKKKEKGEAKL